MYFYLFFVRVKGFDSELMKVNFVLVSIVDFLLNFCFDIEVIECKRLRFRFLYFLSSFWVLFFLYNLRRVSLRVSLFCLLRNWVLVLWSVKRVFEEIFLLYDFLMVKYLVNVDE